MKGLENPPTISSFEVALILVILLAVSSAFCSSCASVEWTDPSGSSVKANLGGKGCAVLERDKAGNIERVVIEHDGMSNPLAGTLRSIIGSAAGVFGGGETDAQKIAASEGCAGVLGSTPEEPAPESSAVKEAAQGAAQGAVEGFR